MVNIKNILRVIFLVFLVNVMFGQMPEILPPVIPNPTVSIYISPLGNDDNNGTSSSPVATFQKALTLIPFGTGEGSYGEVVFLEGDYYPNAGLIQHLNQYEMGSQRKNVSIRGEGLVNIYGDENAEANHLINLRGSGISIKNVNLFNAKGIGVLISNRDTNGALNQSRKMENVHIQDVTLDGTISHGIISILVKNLLIENTVVTNSCQENTGANGKCQWGSSLRTGYCENIIFRNCEVFQNRGEGINIATSTNALVENCTTYDNYAPNIYCIRSNKAIFRNNLIYNRDSTFWINCQPDNGGIPQKRKLTAGFSIANEVGYDDFFSNDCTPVKTYENGLFSNKMADSIFFYNNILILAPLVTVDESRGNCLFPGFSHANNFSNIFIEHNTFIGDIDEGHEYMNNTPLITMTFDPSYFWGCFPNINGVGKYRAENIIFSNNVISSAQFLEGEEISPSRIFYGGRPCNGGRLNEKFTSSGNLWHHTSGEINDHFAAERIPNFLVGEDNNIDNEMLTAYDPSSGLTQIVPNSVANENRFVKKVATSTYIKTDFSGNIRGKDGLTNAGALEDSQIISNVYQDRIFSELVAFPNPSFGMVYIKHISDLPIEIQVYDVLGQLYEGSHYKLEDKLIELNISSLQNGIYYITIRTESETQITKILKVD